MAVSIKGRKQDAQAPQPELPSRRLAAIMFTDLVGYSAMAHRDEALAIELLELHRGWVREILPRYAGQEIETIGDAFLISFTGALSAVECAIALQARFAEHNRVEPPERGMKLRIGIHLGDIEHRAGKVMGDGVNIAARIHGLAPPGGICVSEDVHRAVRNRSGLRFTSLGTPSLKNISTPLELYELHAGPDSLRKAVVTKARRAVGRIPKWLLYPVLAIALISFFSDDDRPLVTIDPGDGAPSTPAGASAPLAVVMVPPFENHGAKADDSLVEGLQQAVIEHLGRAGGLDVVSMGSVLRNPMGNLQKLSGERGAGHLLVGTVERDDQRLQVEVELVDTRSGKAVWNSDYERDLGDVATVQADIAQRIASAVRAKVAPPN